MIIISLYKVSMPVMIHSKLCSHQHSKWRLMRSYFWNKSAVSCSVKLQCSSDKISGRALLQHVSMSESSILRFFYINRPATLLIKVVNKLRRHIRNMTTSCDKSIYSQSASFGWLRAKAAGMRGFFFPFFFNHSEIFWYQLQEGSQVMR